MHLKLQVCSQEFATKLKEFGAKQESLYYWHQTPTNEWNITYYALLGCYTGDLFKNSISAFTVSELTNLLPLIKAI